MKKIDKLIIAIEKLYEESNENANHAAMGYDEGFYSGEATAYAEVLSMLKEAKGDNHEIQSDAQGNERQL